jgi:bacterioferritin-associated ferredoxin
MYICLCKGITESQIQRSVHKGSKNLREVRKDLDVASQCGRCLHDAKKVIKNTLQEQKHESSGIQVAFFNPAQA